MSAEGRGRSGSGRASESVLLSVEALLRRVGSSDSLRPRSAPGEEARAPICPHCWMVNPGPFRLCVRCGADMSTSLQESGGLRRTAPVQSPVPVLGGPRLTVLQRIVVGGFVLMMVLSYLSFLLPVPVGSQQSSRPAPASSNGR